MSKLTCLFPYLREYANIFWLLCSFNTYLKAFPNGYVRPATIQHSQKNAPKTYGMATNLLSIVLLLFSTPMIAQTVDMEYLNPTSGNGNPYQYVRFGTPQDYKAGFMWNNNSVHYGDGDDFSIFTYDDRDITLRPGNGNVIVFPNAGNNMGVGTQNPSGKLHIVDNSSLGGKWQPDKSYLTVSNGTDHLLIDNNEIYGFQTLHIGSRSGDIVKFRTVSDLGSTDHVVIKANGRVGIGTITPDSKLTVTGKIHAEEVKVDLSVPGPDYVFKEDYKLKSLKELQSYIKEHGHLPNIPSAKEMEEKGIDLGEMNMKLLEKIEELTLYTLSQERRIQELKEQNLRISTLEKDIQQLRWVLLNMKK